jgi:hypothetical protein
MPVKLMSFLVALFTLLHKSSRWIMRITLFMMIPLGLDELGRIYFHRGSEVHGVTLYDRFCFTNTRE